jgi:hypothetical protein
MAKFQKKERDANDVVQEVRAEADMRNAEALSRHTTHLCINGWRDVILLTGALGTGVALAKLGESHLKGNWRAAPMVVGLVLSIAARATDPRRIRFVQKAARAVGGLALMTSTVHFTMQSRIDADRALEA